jgi:ankyrin repeat protein
VKLLLEKGAEVESKDKYNQTPLSWAAYEGHETVVNLLIQSGAELRTNVARYHHRRLQRGATTWW